MLLETDVSNNTQGTYTQTPNVYGELVSQRVWERPALAPQKEKDVWQGND